MSTGSHQIHARDLYRALLGGSVGCGVNRDAHTLAAPLESGDQLEQRLCQAWVPSFGASILDADVAWNSKGLFDAARVAESAGFEFTRIPVAPVILARWVVQHFEEKIREYLGDRHCVVCTGNPIPRASALNGRDNAGSWVLEPQVRGHATISPGSMLLTLGALRTGTALFLVDLRDTRSVTLANSPFDTICLAGPTIVTATEPLPARLVVGCDRTRQLLPILAALGQIVTAAEMIGISALLVELAKARANRRCQFGKPIASFQAMAHLLAAIASDMDSTIALLYATLGEPFNAGAAQKLKFLASTLCPQIIDRSIYVFGAEGLVWDRGLHWAVKRVLTLRNCWPVTPESIEEARWDEAPSILDHERT